MTIKEYLWNSLSKAKIFTLYGGGVFFSGVILGVLDVFIPYNFLLEVVGVFLIFFGLYYAFYLVRCPECGYRYGLKAYMYSNIKFELDPDMISCPKCDVSLNKLFSNPINKNR